MKGNQGHFHQSIKDFFTVCREDNFSNVPHQFHEEVDAGHGQIKYQKYWLSGTLTSVKDLTDKWSDCMAESERHINEKESKEVRYFICSIKADVKVFTQAVRKHWSIENQSHWIF